MNEPGKNQSSSPASPEQAGSGPARPLIVVPLVASQPEEAPEQARRLASRQPDIIEVRLDYLEELADNEVGPLLKAIKEAAGLPLLATFRRQEEGGARPLAENARTALLQAALQSQALSYLDIELRTSGPARVRLLEQARHLGVTSVVSYHDFNSTPPLPRMQTLFEELAATGADILKLAVFPRVPEDTLNLLAATRQASLRHSRPLVTMAMGPLGSFTRLAGPFFGSVWSFAVGEYSSAPGQISIDTLRQLWQNWNIRLE